MSDLQEQVMQMVEEMSEENLKVFVQFMKKFVQPKNDVIMSADTHPIKTVKRIGIAESEELYDHDYDFDEYNSEIEKMFGAVG